MKNFRKFGTRRWIGASALAVIIAISGVASFGVGNYQALAQAGVSQVAQVVVPPSGPASFADLVQAVKPAVVSISVQGSQKVAPSSGPSGPNGQDYYFNFPDLPPNNPLRRFFEQFGQPGQSGPQHPQSRKFEAAGSGFIISADGYVVTNNHVVENADKVTVVLDNGDELPAKIIGTDPRTDLALLKINDGKDLPFVKFSDKEARVGDWVLAVGNPFGLGGTVTAGIVSARGRDISGSATGDFLQIDAAVNRGNSGGPAFALDGTVVGVNTAIFSPNGGSVGIAFAIPASIVKQIVSDLKASGHVTRGFLGVSIQDVTKDIADSVGLPTARGALVTEPRAGSPAATAGIKSGDVIVQVDGEAIDNALALSRLIASKAPGSKVAIVVWRDGKKIDLSITLSKLDETQVAQNDQQQQPVPQQAEPVPSSVGVTLVPNADGPGVLIQDVNPDSVAATKGFAVGDVILEVDNTKVSSAAEFEKAITGVRDSGRATALIKTSRNGNIRFIGLPVKAN